MRLRSVFVALAVALSAAASSAEKPAAEAAPDPASPAASQKRFYVPPAPGKRLEGGRVGAGTRSVRATRCAARLTVLAPEDHVGLTVEAQPTLFFLLAEDTPCSVQFVLNDRRQVPPLVEASVLEAGRKGLHAIRLADHGITLEPGVDYDWFVQVTDDPSRRAPQNFSGAQVRRIEPPPDLEAALAAPGAVRSRVLGAHSLWYDAVAAQEEEARATSGQDRAAPPDAGMLEEVGISLP